MPFLVCCCLTHDVVLCFVGMKGYRVHNLTACDIGIYSDIDI